MHPLASVARAVKLNVLAAVGVPDSNPPPLSVSPVGSAPEARSHVIGSVPPVCVNCVAGYDVPVVPFGSDPGPIVIVGQFTVIVTVTSPKQPFASVALTVTGNEPCCVGVPDTSPVAVLNVRPVGSAPVSST